MIVFHSEPILVEYITMIYNEGREDDIIKVCDYYHNEFPTMQDAFDWGFNFGEYVGKSKYGDLIYRLSPISNDKIAYYFIGSYHEVKNKISATL